jgi:hypothetical protein
MYSRRSALATILGSTVGASVLRADPRGPFFNLILRQESQMRWDKEGNSRFSELRRVPAGSVKIPSGKVVSASVMELNQARSLPVKVKPGSYPVELILAEHPERGSLVTAALLRLAAGTPAGWEATDCGLDRPGCSFTNFGGLACFADAEAISLWKQLRKAPADLQQVVSELDQNVRDNLSAGRAELGEIILTDDNAVNVVAYRPASAEATPTNWFGLSSSGQVLSVMVDFGMHDAVVFPYGRPTL